MNRFFHGARALLLAAAASVCLIAAAQVPAPPEIAARSYLLLDVTANQIPAQKDIDSPVEPASLTKLMSAYIVFDALRAKKITLTQTLPVSPRAWKMPGSRMFIDPKMQVPVEDLIKGLIVQSGNDATVALAEGVGGTVEHFVELMNAQAKVLGMKNTTYKNPEGLTAPGHTTTARDLGILATRLVRDFPEEAKYYAIKKYRYPGTPSTNDTNRNLLLFRDPTVDGLKTGHTEAAGYCMIATAKRDFPNLTGGRRLLSIVLGASGETVRANESQKLLNWGYTAYDAVRLFDGGQAPRPRRRSGRASRTCSSSAAPSRSWSPCPPAWPASSRPRSRAPTRWWRRSPSTSPWARSRSRSATKPGGRGAAGGAGAGRTGRHAGPCLGCGAALDQVIGRVGAASGRRQGLQASKPA